MTQGGSSDSNRHQTSREKCFFFFKLVRRPHPLHSLHSCWSWCAPAVLSTGFCKAKKKSFPGETNMGSHQLLLSLCQRQQLNISPDTDLLLLQPSWKLKAVSEPQKYYSRIFEGVKKKKKKKKEILLQLCALVKWSPLEHQVSARCFLDPLIYLPILWKLSRNSTCKQHKLQERVIISNSPPTLSKEISWNWK